MATSLARNIEPSVENSACQVNNPLQQICYYSDQDFDTALRPEIGQVAYSLNDGQCRARVAGFIQLCLGVSEKYLCKEHELESVSWASCWHLVSQIQMHVSCVFPAVLNLAFGLKGCLSSHESHVEGFSRLHQGLQFSSHDPDTNCWGSGRGLWKPSKSTVP